MYPNERTRRNGTGTRVLGASAYIGIAWLLALLVFATDRAGRTLDFGIGSLEFARWQAFVGVLPGLLLIGFAILSTFEARNFAPAWAAIGAALPWLLIAAFALLAIAISGDDSSAYAVGDPSSLEDRTRASAWLAFGFAFPGAFYFGFSWMARLIDRERFVARWLMAWLLAALPTVGLAAFASRL